MEIRSTLDGRVLNTGVPRYRNLNGKHLVPVETAGVGNDIIYLKVQTSQSELRVAMAARMRLFSSGQPIEFPVRITQEPGCIDQHFEVKMVAGQSVCAEKIVTLFTSRDRASSECGLAARETVAEAAGFAELAKSHAEAWKQLWDRFDMELEFATPTAEQNHTCLILQLHLFHLLQTTSPDVIELDVGVPARGWHGEAYRGHIFWDELFIFPLLNLRIPDIPRALLKYRSWKLFTEALQSDFADVQGGTTLEGIHLGAMAGTVDLIQRCHLGIETRQDVIWLNPQLPHELTRLRVRIRYAGTVEKCDGSLMRVRGFQFSEEVKLSKVVNFLKREEVRHGSFPGLRICGCDVLPQPVDIDKIHVVRFRVGHPAGGRRGVAHARRQHSNAGRHN